MLGCTFVRVRHEAALALGLIDEANVLDAAAAAAAASGAGEPSDEPHADADDARRLVESTLLARVAFERKFDYAFVLHTLPRADADLRRIVTERRLALPQQQPQSPFAAAAPAN